MKQAIHIFAKDARRLWLEIAVVLAVTALFAWLYPQTWMPTRSYASMGMEAGVSVRNTSALAGLVSVLVPVSWWILMTRLVQSENLVGDRQWWATKPYEWPQLLGAKVLFVAVFAGAPLLIAQWVLLARAGFGPLGYLPGQGYGLLLAAMTMVLPVAALAVVTSRFGKTVLTGFGVLLALIAALLVVGWRKNGDFSVMLPWHLADLLAVTTAAAMMFAYARRRVGLTRWLLAGIFLVGLGMGYLTYSTTVIEAAYPASAGGVSMRLGMDGSRLATANLAPNLAGKKSVDVSLPVSVTGLGSEDAVNLDAAQVTVKALDGRSWTSPWEMENRDHLQAGVADATIGMVIDEAFLEAVKAEPVELDLRFALTRMRAMGTAQVAMEGRDFAVPEFGICSPVPDVLTSYPTGIRCRAALREPPLTFISVRWADDGCAEGPAALASGLAGGGWTGAVEQGPADLNLAAVWSSGLGLSNGIDQEKFGKRGQNPQRYLCPGTPMTFTRYALLGRMLTAMTVTNFHVPEWRATGAVVSNRTVILP
ncbi:MAG TPA: hypothetical protein VHX37_14250 [Acidobacteriaceae bacterium]|jgi:hypothetical protein|nr:hypothetical protein [Acidobacteriaceae bacterium]